MKKIQITLLFLVALCFLSNVLNAQKNQVLHNQNRVITQQFSVNPKDLLEIDTRNVKVVVEEWGKKEISFITTLTLHKSTKEDMENLMKALKLTNKQSGKSVSYYLRIDWSGDKKTNNLHGLTEITLEIKAPKDIYYKIMAQHGDVEMESIHNNFNATIAYGNLNVENIFGNKNNIEIKYGNLTMEDLHGNNNLIAIKYGKFNIYKADHLNLDVKYAQGKIQKTGVLKIDSKYCNLVFDSGASLIVSSGYDKISFQNSIDNIKGDMKYGTFLIGSLKYTFNVDLSYSKLKIDEVLPSFSNISILSRHSDILLNIPKEQSFNIDYSGKYTQFKDEKEKWNYTAFEAGSNSLQMSGFYGTNPNSKKNVSIQAVYGSVSLFGK